MAGGVTRSVPLGPYQTVLLRGQAHAQPSWALDTGTGSDVRSVALGLPSRVPSDSAARAVGYEDVNS